MLTKAFENAMVSALLRIPGMTQERVAANLDTLCPLCKLIEYNETDELDTKSDEERLLLFSHSTTLPEHLQGVRNRANTFVNNNVGFRTAFETSTPSAKSIIYVGLGLYMTVDEINSVLLSYSHQTISWHRVEDLLLRYAVEKGWSYATLLRVMDEYHAYLNREEAGQDGAPQWTAEAPSDVDSSYLTRQNISIFYEKFAGGANDYTVFRKLHELFAPIERSSSGAPRRTFLKMVRLLQGRFSRHIAVGPKDGGKEESCKEISFNACGKKRVRSAHLMLYEAAGMKMPDVGPEEAKATLDGVIHAIDDLMSLSTKRGSARIDPPSAWFDAGAQAVYAQRVRNAREKSLLKPGVLLNTAACELILHTVDCDLPPELRDGFYTEGILKEPMDSRMLRIASLVQGVCPGSNALEQSYRSSMFHLLLCCGCGSVRPLLADDIERLLRCFGFAVLETTPGESPESVKSVARALGYHGDQLALLMQYFDRGDEDKRKSILNAVLLPQTVVRKHIARQLNQILDVFDPRRRNSEPSVGFLMLLAVYTFGYAVGNNRAAFGSTQAERYVQKRLREAWSGVDTDPVYQSALYRTVVQLIHSAFDWIREQRDEGKPLAVQWLGALHAVCEAHTSACRQADLERIRSFVMYSGVTSIASSNPLSSVSIVSHGWTI